MTYRSASRCLSKKSELQHWRRAVGRGCVSHCACRCDCVCVCVCVCVTVCVCRCDCVCDCIYNMLICFRLPLSCSKITGKELKCILSYDADSIDLENSKM